MKTYVYWIHLKGQTDIFNQGYVGISSNVKKRWEAHKYSPENPYLRHVVNKYGWDALEKEIVLVGSRDYCKLIEKQLRPEDKIGWNLVKGGGDPPTHSGEKSHFFGKGHLIQGKNCRFFKGPIIATNLKTGVKTAYYGNKQLEAAGFTQTNVSKCVLGKRKTHKGHTFIQQTQNEK